MTQAFATVFGTLSVKDPTFGAKGDGVTDDRAAIQACFDAAFGTAAAPHGTANKYLNRRVIFPPGNYLVGGPLYLTNVESGIISGSGMDNTTLTYTGTLSGNVVGQGNLSGGNIALVRAITPLIITQGFAYSKLENMSLVISGANTVAFYLFWNGTGGAGPTSNTYSQVAFNGAGPSDHCAAGALIGYLSTGLCSEQLFLGCGATYCDFGFRNVATNALNNKFLLCSASFNTTAFSAPTGNIVIDTASLSNNITDIVVGQLPITIIGTRTESANFIDLSGASSNVAAYISGCIQASGAGVGYFVNMGANVAVIDCCQQESVTATDGVIAGSAGKVYLRGNDFRNTSYLANYTGLVSALDIPNGLVSALPTANAKYKGLRALVTDATATTFLSTVAGTGSNVVPVVCDGTNWKIG